MSDFSFTCRHCQKESEFEPREIDGWAELVSDERSDAAANAELAFDGWIDPSNLRSSAARLVQLSIAIERGDKAEATILLDQVASSLGEITRERVACARFTPQARLPLPHVPV